MTFHRVARRAIIALLAFLTAVPLFATGAVGTADAAPGDQARAKIVAERDSVLVTVSNALMSQEDGHLVIRNAAGKILDPVPLQFTAPDSRTYPIDLALNGSKARLTPSRDVARSNVDAAALLQRKQVADKNGYESQDKRDAAALSRMVDEVKAGATVSTIIGAALGAVLGGVVGCIIGLAGTPLGCFFAGIPLGAAAGTGIGIILSGGVAGAAVLHYFDTINKPFKHVKQPSK